MSTVSAYIERERIDLKLGVVAVTAGRKPLLQFCPICVSEIVDRAIARAPGARGHDHGVFGFPEHCRRRRRRSRSRLRRVLCLRQNTGALTARRQPPIPDLAADAGVLDTYQ